MEIDFSMFLTVCPLVFIGGLVDAVAGGGGLITLPAYMLAGLPIHFAIGTNKLSASIGNIMAAYRYYKEKYVDSGILIPSIIASFAGSILGSKLSLGADERLLEMLLVGVLPITAFYILRKKDFTDSIEAISRRKMLLYAIGISLIVGCYVGFYGPGGSTFLILLYTGLAKINIRIASGHTKFVNLTANLVALAAFMYSGKVLILLGLCAGLFSIAGNYIGAGIVIKRGGDAIRPIIIVVLALLFFKVAYNILTKSFTW